MILITKMVLAHLLGDFVLQPASWVKARDTHGFRAWQLYVHAALHGALAALFVGKISFLPWAVMLAALHFVTDAGEQRLQQKYGRRTAFFADQAIHLTTLLLIALLYQGPITLNTGLLSGPYLLLVTILVFLTTPASYVTSTFISRWTPQSAPESDLSLQNAGKYIGILERLLAFVFIVAGHWEGVGFLVAAKSIFRFGDLREANDRKLTEYILIGTLLSFGLAVCAALVYLSAIAR